MNYLVSASVSLAGSRQGSKAVEKRRRVARRTGAVEDAACSTGANPPRPMRRFYHVSEVRIAPDRGQFRFRGLVPCRLDLGDDVLGQCVGIAVDVPKSERLRA